MMNSRMSRLRRSLSRSVYQLNSTLSRQSSLNGLVELPTIQHTELVEKFATPGNFRQLRDLVRQNNEGLAEIVSAFEEKAALDFHYSKTLKKISARLHKITQQSQCEIDKGWASVAEQFDVHATLHSNLGSALTDDVVQPLRAIQTTQQRTIRAAESLVDRETKKLKDRKEATQKLKRQAYILNKELEKLEQVADVEKNGPPAKFALRKKKAQEQAIHSEEDYLWQTIDLEKQRSVTENVLRKGVESLEAVEKQRLAHCQTALGRYQRKIEHLGPNLQQMFERHANNLDVAVDYDVGNYIAAIVPSTSAVNHITLLDLYAENFGEVMAASRRRSALERISSLLDFELKRLYTQGTADVMVSNCRQMNSLEFIEYLYYKVNDAINSLDGGQHRGFHRLARFQHKLKDKSGLPMTLLTLPLSGEDNSLPPPTTGPATLASESRRNSHYGTSSRGSEEYEEYDKISDEGFYNSNSTSRQTTVIDEPANQTLCRVLYDFEPKHDDEIAIRAGQCVLVENRIGVDWLVGHVISDPNLGDQVVPGSASRTGRFPTSYVAF